MTTDHLDAATAALNDFPVTITLDIDKATPDEAIAIMTTATNLATAHALIAIAQRLDTLTNLLTPDTDHLEQHPRRLIDVLNDTEETPDKM